MEKRLLAKDAPARIASALAREKTVYAPVREDDNLLIREIRPDETPQIGCGNTKNAPKAAFFPRTEVMMRYARTGKGMELTREEDPAGEAVLFGVRPCDARSFRLLDLLFDQDKYRDPFYCDRRAKTTVVAVACAVPPSTSCFCTSVDGAPVSEDGADVLLTDLGDAWLAEFLTPKGEALAGAFGGEAAGADAETKKAAVAAAAEQAISRRVPAHEIKAFLDANFEHPFWNTIHQRCLACGTCTFLCPTCHCFDIGDEVKYDDGRRLRNWDSCMFPLFTKEASGHNPRSSQKERWRQRVMHKFRYYVNNFSAISCVGCGRCVQFCPVNIDIRKIVDDIAKL